MNRRFTFWLASFAIALVCGMAQTAPRAISFPRQAIALGVPCVNPDSSRGTCEAYNECAHFSIRSYIRGELGVCGFMPNGDPAVCCHVSPNVGNSLTSSNGNGNGNGAVPQGSGTAGVRDDNGGRQPNNAAPSPSKNNRPPPPFGGNAPPPTLLIPGINVGFDPDSGDLARIRG